MDCSDTQTLAIPVTFVIKTNPWHYFSKKYLATPSCDTLHYNAINAKRIFSFICK